MKTITVKTSELTGAALDWAVAQIEEVNCYTCPNSPDKSQFVDDERAPFGRIFYSPRQLWSQCGPLIDKYDIWFSSDDGIHIASLPPHTFSGVYTGDIKFDFPQGPTKLIAACRAIVASKLGDTVEVPEQLVEVKHGN